MDPNKTIAGGFDPNRTAAMGNVDPNRTAAMGAFDPNRTSAMGVSVPDRALAASIVPGRDAAMANGPGREQFLLELTAANVGGAAGSRTPLNVCLVIDRSGSMEGAPLEYAKAACSYVVDLLSPDDVLSIVTFEEVVDLLMPPQRVTNRQVIKDGIARLTVGNTTDLYGGMALAAQQLATYAEANRATRMLVLSDGDPTTGIKDFGALTTFASEIKGRGVTVTFLGFGPDYNEELLAGMAKRAGGNYYFVPRPELLPEIFRTELEKLMTVAARNLSLKLRPARWVNLRSHGGGSEREITLPLADLERGSTLDQIFDFEFPNHPLGWYRIAEGVLSYDDSLTGRTETIDLDFIIEFTADAARYSAPQNPKVKSAGDLALASRVVEKTIMGLKTQQLTAAMAIQDLQRTQALLLSEGRHQEAQEVTMALRAIQTGDAGTAEKTLMGTMLHLDQGKH